MDAYWWSGLDWKAIFTAIGVIGTAAYPSVSGWASGRIKTAETTQERLDRREQNQYEHVVEDRDKLWQRVEALEHDRDEGWDLCRGWEAYAHDLRHDLRDRCASFNALVSIGRDLLSGKIDQSRFGVILDLTPPAIEPPRLPPVRGMDRLPPDQAVSSAE